MTFAAQLESHRTMMFSAAMQILRSYEDAEDATQTAMFKAWRARKSFAGQSKLSTWLTRITINESLMLLRYKRCRPTEEYDAAPQKYERTAPHDQEKACIDKNFLDKLVSEKKNFHTLLAVKRDGFGTKELAGILGIAESAVKARIWRARQEARRKAAEL